ncbi:MAG: DUF4394 domain-containing protein [Acidobacteria bacterium]|nr:DUF4394 domain-containing protein [Acidobacteriota bacterium]
MAHTSQSVQRWTGRTLALLVVLLAPSAARAVPVVGLLDFNRFVVFDSASPGTIIRSGTIAGLPAGERIVAIDFRPATGRLYALGMGFSRLYVINPQTMSVVQAVGRSSFTPPLNSPNVGFDFDPALDRARAVSDDVSANRQNLTFNPDPTFGGDATVETPPEFAPGDPNGFSRPALFGIAYDNNFMGATHSQLYGIHRADSVKIPFLVTIAPGNGGQVRTVGALIGTGTGAQVTSEVGFDIAPVSGVAYVAMKTNSISIIHSQFYTVNLVTGAATFVGEVGQVGIVTDIAVMPPASAIYAVSDRHELLKFDGANPETIISRAPITGLLAGEQIYELDFRPLNGKLYGLGRTAPGATNPSNHLYVVNTSDGVATPVIGSTDFSIPTLSGDAGFDFSPLSNTLHTLRIVTGSEQNLTVDPDGLSPTLTNLPLAYVAGDPRAGRDPNVVAAAYSNNFQGASSTTLYDIDRDFAGAGTWLVTQGSKNANPQHPDSGKLLTVRQVGVGIPVDFVGFDIAPGAEGIAYLSTISMDDGFSRLSVFNVNRGGGGEVGVIGAPGNLERIRDLAVAPNGGFRFSSNLTEITEDSTAVRLTVERTGDVSNEATVDFATEDDGKARSRSDYTAASGTILFAAGQSSRTIEILINEDSIVERGVDDLVPFDGESFSVTLNNPTGGFTLLSNSGRPRTVVFIRDDDDAPGAANSIDDTTNFVRQHYHDFLSREADASGLAFWVNNIESCGESVGCRQVKRIDTSAAFFLSIEFQQTGYLVYRAQQAAFARAPVPVRLEEFLPDTQRIGRDVVIGAPGANEKLEANKRAFFDDFVMRPAFLAQYPQTLTAAQFVDALNANTGGSLSPAERDDLVSRLSAGQVNRAQALRAVAEDADFVRRESNRAFVLMQYFGYLRRNPNDFPDADFSGYDFWLAKLDSFNGDFRRAEMVKAFITSTEYRKRFGP